MVEPGVEINLQLKNRMEIHILHKSPVSISGSFSKYPSDMYKLYPFGIRAQLSMANPGWRGGGKMSTGTEPSLKIALKIFEIQLSNPEKIFVHDKGKTPPKSPGSTFHY